MTISALVAKLMGLTPVLRPVGDALWDSRNDGWEDGAKHRSFFFCVSCVSPHFLKRGIGRQGTKEKTVSKCQPLVVGTVPSLAS